MIHQPIFFVLSPGPAASNVLCVWPPVLSIMRKLILLIASWQPNINPVGPAPTIKTWGCVIYVAEYSAKLQSNNLESYRTLYLHPLFAHMNWSLKKGCSNWTTLQKIGIIPRAPDGNRTRTAVAGDPDIKSGRACQFHSRVTIQRGVFFIINKIPWNVWSSRIHFFAVMTK